MGEDGRARAVRVCACVKSGRRKKIATTRGVCACEERNASNYVGKESGVALARVCVRYNSDRADNVPF